MLASHGHRVASLPHTVSAADLPPPEVNTKGFVSLVPATALQEISTNIAAGRVAGSPQRHPALDWLYLDGSYAALEALLALWRQLKLGRALEGNILAQATNTTWAWMVT